MRILVDADACPKAVKEILYRACERTKIELILVANRSFIIPASPLIKLIQVALGFDEADKKIIEIVQEGDLVITADIPLADEVIKKLALALNPRGKLYTRENIKQQLAVRDLMAQLRDDRLVSGGPSVYSKSDSQALANQLIKLLYK